MRYNKIYYILLLLAGLMYSATSCVDEFEVEEHIPEGYSRVTATVSFADFTPALENSRAGGNAIRAINKLWVVVYTTSGELVKYEDFTGKFTITGNTRPDGKPSSETQTGHAEISMTLPNGKYRMYAVANCDLTAGDVASEEALRSKRLTWDNTQTTENTQNAVDAHKNSEMIGYFTNGDGNNSSALGGFDKRDHTTVNENDPGTPVISADEVTIKGGTTQLHAWLKRAASKVTVAFDTSNLRENVYIYIKSVAIRDIPKENYLGKRNRPDPEDEDRNISSELWDKGESIYLGSAAENQTKADYTSWKMIASGDSVWGLRSDKVQTYQPTAPDGDKGISGAERQKRRIEWEHGEEAPALYFYENSQPEGTLNTESDKRQDVTGNNAQVSYPEGVNPSNTAWKDARPYGSYIEVVGYYDSSGDLSRPGKGDIIYRFMLGKNTTTDYDAERNHHYKLTLKFNGYANDIDWHIDYKEEAKPGLLTPDTTYVSYLYNQTSTTTARAIPKEGYRLKSLTATILENEWRPYDVDSDLYNSKAWAMQTGEGGISQGLYVGGQAAANELDPECAPNCEYGFLSLRKVTRVDITIPGGGQYSVNQGDFATKMRAVYYCNDAEDASKPKGKREYSVPAAANGPSGTVYPDATDGDYHVILTEKDILNQDNQLVKERTYLFQIPLYTRAKSIDTWSTFTGANPFYQHNRYARIKFVAVYENIDNPDDTYEDKSYTNVLQARRIDNPRAIYRSASNNASFHVNLKYAILGTYAGVENVPVGYQSLVSRGPWRATIEKDPHGIVNLSANGQTANGAGRYVTGKTNTEVDFIIGFNQETVGDDDAYGAIINVTYHNNSCVHKILVRRGYGPTTFPNGTLQWSTFNVYSTTQRTKSPLSIGSFFRRNIDITYPIAESNNTRTNFGVGESPNASFRIHGKSNTAWGSIPFMPKDDLSTEIAFGDFTLDGIAYRVPTIDEMVRELTNNDMNYAFGIIYGDGSTATLSDDNTFSYSDTDNNGLRLNQGVRGVVAYSLSTGRNIPFPFGATGHGRRKNAKWRLTASKGLGIDGVNGLLRYGSIDVRLGGYDGAQQKRNGIADLNEYRPLAYDLPAQYGSGYWGATGEHVQVVNNGNLVDRYRLSTDFNYGNYNTGWLTEDDLYTNGNKSDALPIKPVRR